MASALTLRCQNTAPVRRGYFALHDVLFTMKIVCIIRATLDSDRHWIPLELGTGSIGWAPKRFEGTAGNKVPHILRPQDTEEHWQSVDPQCTSPAVA